MLGGLGKELRRCGVDVVILENNREHTDVAKVYLLNKEIPNVKGLLIKL
jgi:hypothetical protein